MTRTATKAVCKPAATNLTRHTNCRKLRKRMDRIDRRRLNHFAKAYAQGGELAGPL